MAKTNKEQYEVLMSELATTIKNLTNSTGKLTLEQIVTKAKQITPAPTLSGNATVNQVLKDATFYNTDPNTKLTGTIETFTPSEVTSNGTLQTSGKYVNADIVVKVPSPTLNGDAEASNVLAGKTFYSNSTTKQTGTMFNNGQEHGIINNTTTPRYPISQGYHDGTGYVEINASQIADCVAANILQGKTILGVQGTLVKGITPSGKKAIISTAETDVTNFATAQVVDSNLVASNIKKDISILGITGTFEEGITPTGTLDITTNGVKDVTNYASVNVNVPLPTLNAPTISLSNSTVTITNPVTNGSFVSGYDVYKNGTLLTSITLATVDLSTLITDSGTYTITVKAKGTNFNESPRSNEVNYTVTPAGGYTLTIVQEQSGGELKVTKFDGTQEWISETISNVVSIDDVKYNGDYGKPYYLSPSISTPFTLTEDMTITIYSEPCFVEGTLITMADGTQKKVEDINYGDEVLCYDFNEGKQTTAPIEFIMKKMQSNFYYKVSLSDGTELKLVGSNGKSHRLYNITKEAFIYPQDFEKNDYTLKQDGTIATISSIEKIEKKVNFYNIASKDHINVYAKGVLTSNRLSNRFEIKDNKYTDRQLMTDEEIKAYKEHMERLKK
nr:MAG TPA: tail protein [Caudoviricetes sp.]